MDRIIGFIGLGAMGKPMAINLLNAGYEIICHDINREAVGELVALGAQEGTSSVDIAQRSRIIITILPADAQIMQVYTAEDGILRHIQDGSVCIDMTSAMPSTIHDVKKASVDAGKSISLLDAPVSGGVFAAQKGTLTIMAGGDADIFDSCRDILEAMGTRVYYTGLLGSGKAVKMINQLLNAGNTYILSEALYLAHTMDIDTDALCQVVNESSGGSWVFQNNLPKFILPENFEGGFTLELMHKDVSLGMQQAHNKGVEMPGLNLILQAYQSMCELGYAKSNYNVISKWIEFLNKSKD